MPPFVSRGGLKLHHALSTFALDPAGLRCADLGCSTGGFTDCLLQAGAASVIAVDTGYGVLAYTLRKDPRVIVRERENALHAPPPSPPVDLVVIDAGWTPQRLIIPAALAWVRPGGAIVSLVKPHYEDEALAKQHRGILPDELAQHVALAAIDALAALPACAARAVSVAAHTRSPIRGGVGRANKSKRAPTATDAPPTPPVTAYTTPQTPLRAASDTASTPPSGAGNLEWLVLLKA